MDHALWGSNPVRILMDHRDLLYVFALLALRPNSPVYVLWKVHRLPIFLSRFDFIIEHIYGSNNISVNRFPRWFKGY